jgi:hypothetical protein
MRTNQEIQTQEYASVGVFGEIKLLNDELDIVERTLSKQRQIILDYCQTVDVATDDNASDMQTYSTKLRKRVLDRSIKSLDQKIGDFRELKDRANYMQFSVGRFRSRLLVLPSLALPLSPPHYSIQTFEREKGKKHSLN